MWIRFSKLNQDILTSVGAVAYMTKTRPSDIISWTDPKDWFERIRFDIIVLGPICEKMKGDVHNAV